jgi:hypothetical protein
MVEERMFICQRSIEPIVSEETALANFFVKVSEDESLFEEYKRDPEEVLKRSGLSADTIRSVLTGDLKAIRRVLGPRVHPGLVIVIVLQSSHS